jgi:hypothetical protein
MVLVRTGLAFVEPFDLDSGFQCGYCYRHDFQTAKDRTLHECNSHLVCMKQGCRKQYDRPQDLIQHCRETKCSFVCRGCRTIGKIWHFNITGYWNHIQEQNVCTKCERHFDTQSNLIHVCPTSNSTRQITCLTPLPSTNSPTAPQPTPASASTASASSPPTAA